MGIFSSIFGTAALKKSNKKAQIELQGGQNDALGYYKPYADAAGAALPAYQDA